MINFFIKVTLLRWCNLTLINENDQENDDVSGVMLVMVMVMV